jgi:glycosyltransferase involved in cell wall biosynthesis
VLLTLTVLSVSYPLAKVAPGTAGGAEQVLATIDRALVHQGHRSLVLAPEGSRCHGLLIPAQIPSGTLDDLAKAQSRLTFKELLDHTLVRYSVDVVHMHGLDFSEYLPDHDLPLIVSLHLPLNWYAPHALQPSQPNTKLVSVSRFQARTAPPDAHIACVVPNGVDLHRFRPTRTSGNYLLAMGRICPEKGLHLAIEAAERAQVNLIIAGTVYEYPEHRRYFDSVIAPRLNDRIRFIGPVGGKHKRSLLAGAKCLLIPSQVHETSSLIAMEAMAAGTPVIAWCRGALPDLISDGCTGFLVSSVEEMAHAIARIAEIDRWACRREAENKFDAREMVSRYLKLYQRAARESAIPELQAA